MPADLEMDADDQDMAEIFDEENIIEDGVDIATSDMERDVYDVTTAAGDRDDFDAETDDEFDPDQADDAELDSMMEQDDGIDGAGAPTRDPADLVAGEDSTAAFEGGVDDDDDDDSLYGDDRGSGPPTAKQEKELDHGLDETFPASDPVSISPGAD